MTQASRRTAGILLLILPTVVYGGVSILRLLINDPAYMQNALRQDLWRAGHAHVGILLILSLVALRYVDEANLSNGWKWVVREAIPAAGNLDDRTCNVGATHSQERTGCPHWLRRSTIRCLQDWRWGMPRPYRASAAPTA